MKVFLILGLLVLFSTGAGAYYYFYMQPKPQIASSNYVRPVTAAPEALTLDLTSPDDDLLVFDKQILISGKTSPKAQVLISSQNSDSVIESKEDGNFSTMFDLTTGLNQIQVVVFDLKGDQKEATRSVFYSKEEL